MTDPRIRNLLACAATQRHPYYAAAAYTLARTGGDMAATRRALALGAADYRPEPRIYATTEDNMLDRIITGDAKELAKEIPDQSVDMVFADPEYDKIEDYVWLAKEAARVLKPNKACLVWCSSVQQYDIQPLMRQYLTFVLQLTYTKVAKAYKVWGYKTFLWTTPCLWFQRDGGHFHEDHEWLIDTVLDYGNAVVSTAAPPRDTYKWHKNPEAYRYWLLRFTKPGDVVYDPFCGSGSLPLCCIQHDRHFIASEIVPEVADQARARLAAMRSQPRLPGIDQTTMEFAL